MEPHRKRLLLQPRSKPVESTEPADSESSGEEAPPSAIGMSEKSALKMATEDTKEFFHIRNIEEDIYFTDLPPKFRSKLVEKLVGHVVEAKEVDARLLADFFARAVSKGLCSPEAFEEGFIAIAEVIDDVLYDSPKALDFFVIALKGACLNESRLSNIVSNCRRTARSCANVQRRSKPVEETETIVWKCLHNPYSGSPSAPSYVPSHTLRPKPPLVHRKVKALLNKLTTENFEFIADRVIVWSNNSANKGDGQTLMHITTLILENATCSTMWSGLYARLCKKIMEQISPKVKAKNDGFNHTVGGELFRKYLIIQCENAFKIIRPLQQQEHLRMGLS